MIARQSQRRTASAGSTDVYERRLVVRDGSVAWMDQMDQFPKGELSGMIRTWIPESISIMGPNLFLPGLFSLNFV
jgi:hypothetical protein